MAFASDNYTSIGTNDVVGRVSSGGTTWAGNSGFLVGNSADGVTNSQSSGNGVAVTGTPAGTDYSCQAMISQPNTFRNSASLVGRYQDAVHNNRIEFYWGNGGNWLIQKFDDNNGHVTVATGLATPAPSSTPKLMKFTVSGISTDPGGIVLTGEFDGVTVVSGSITTATTWDGAGKPGIGYRATDSANYFTLDDWEANDAGGSTSGAFAARGVGTQAMVGASIASGAVTMAGVGRMGETGAALVTGALAAAGVGTMSMVGAAIASGVLNAAGVGSASWVGSDGANYQSGAWAAVGVGDFPAIGGSIAAGAMQASGFSVADFQAQPEVTPAQPVSTTDPGPGGGAHGGMSWEQARYRREQYQARRKAMLIAAIKGIAPAVFQAMSRPGYIHIPHNRTLH